MPTLPRLSTPAYFEGQRLTAQILNDDFAAERERRWFHNRALHGVGISSGLAVTGVIGTATVTVEPGHAIDADGRDLILVDPVVLQVPARPGRVDAGSNEPVGDRFVVVCRWNDHPDGTAGTGPCRAAGTTGWSEAPAVELVAETDYADTGVALATVEVFACVLRSIDAGRRRVLGERKLPYVDGGTVAADELTWTVLATDATAGPPVAFGLQADVDTSAAGFGTVPNYQARVSGDRWGTLPGFEGETGRPFVLWTSDAYVVTTGRTGLTLQVVIATAQMLDDGVLISMSLQEFLADAGLGHDGLVSLVTDTLRWGVTWIGVEGTL